MEILWQLWCLTLQVIINNEYKKLVQAYSFMFNKCRVQLSHLKRSDTDVGNTCFALQAQLNCICWLDQFQTWTDWCQLPIPGPNLYLLPTRATITRHDYSSLYERVRITVIVENYELCQGIGLLRDAIPTDKDIIQLFEKFTLHSVQETISQWSQVCIRNHYNPNSCHLYNTQLNFTFREQVISPSFGKMSSY